MRIPFRVLKCGWWRLRAWLAPLIRTCADDSWNSMNPYILVHYCVTLCHVYGMTAQMWLPPNDIHSAHNLCALNGIPPP